ncbi:MAG: hypothetical protein L6Q37_08595 [Bdellovibrionaceae bacterium]|nr:hypothetical protein [Pseudobdellovibrionaceae bacterium]NUM57863.1 hypothetical protein [Pseudobdellovibrionaceae bacterium]
MKTTVIFILTILITGFTISSYSEQRYYGVNDQGQKINLSEFKSFYIVHGGCREYNNNTSLTEIWLYISEKPNTTYDPSNSQMQRGTMYLSSKYGSIESIVICSFLRKALEKQTSIKMDLIPHPYWSNHFLVRTLDSEQVYSNLELIVNNNLLENFSSHQ